jgi:protein gp37
MLPAIINKKIEQIPYSLPRAKATFNRTNDNVGWAGWTWNPITGCLHACPFCYARELAYRLSYAASYPVQFEPIFHHERLDAPANTEVPPEAKEDSRLGRCFTGSMADQYGKWVLDEWLAPVHASLIANPQWEYLVLTKFPRRYVDLQRKMKQLPPTAWVGASVCEQKYVRFAEEAFPEIKNVRLKWLSLEPLRALLVFKDLSMFDFIVIGEQTATQQPWGPEPAFAPPFEWVARLTDQARECGCKVYQKNNLLGVTDPQSPGMKLIQEEPLLTDLDEIRRVQQELKLKL